MLKHIVSKKTTTENANFDIKKYEDIINPFALKEAKIACNFGLSECNRVKSPYCFSAKQK